MKSTHKLGALALIGVLALTGCGRSDDGGGQAEAIELSDGPATGTIEVWTAGGYGEKLEGFVDGFLKDNPDAKIEITDIPWGELVTKIQTAVAAGTAPDVVMVGSSQMAQVISTGGLQPVPDGVYNPDDFFPASVDSVTAQDELYGMPWYVETRVLYYRSDIAAEAGFDSAPTTWDEFDDFVAAVTEKAGTEYGVALPMGDREDSTQVIVPYLAQAGGSLLDASGEKWTLDTPEMAEALDYYGHFFTEGYAPISGYGDTQASDFIDGRNPAFISGQWMIGSFTEAAGADWVEENVATAPVPAGVAGNASYMGGGDLAVFADADNPDGAWKLLSWLGEIDQQQAWNDLSGDFPAVEAAADYEPITSDPRSAVIAEQMTSTVVPPAVPAYDELSGLIEAAAEQVANGKMTGAEAAGELQADADELGLGW